MKTTIKITFGALLFCLLSAQALAQEAPVLRSQVMTLSEIVTVGDFYSNAGLLASKPLFRSPDLGKSGNVSANVVAERARAAGLTSAGTDGLRTVVVFRGAKKLKRDQISGLVRTALIERNAGLRADNLDIRLLQTPDEILADPKVAEPVQIEHVEWSQSNGRFTVHAMVAVEFGTKPLTLTGIATEMVDVIALVQPIRRGEILREEDLDTIRLPRNRVPASAITDPARLIGKQARSNIRASAPLSRKDFQRPILVERGEKVTIIFEMPGMKLTSRAKALDEGAKGDVIDVLNLQSRRIVPATVTSRGLVRVINTNPVVASLNSETKQ